MPLKMKGAVGAHSQEETVAKARLSTSRPVPAQLLESGRGNMDASRTLLDRSFWVHFWKRISIQTSKRSLLPVLQLVPGVWGFSSLWTLHHG